MALTKRIDLKGCIEVENGCTQLLFSDVTGFLVTPCADNYNVNGYGLVGGIALDEVTSAQLNIYYPSLIVPVTFDFTIVNHVITNCLFTDLNNTVTDITALLVSTVFPLTDFDTTLAAYNIILPNINDGIIQWDYTINGQTFSDGELFSYTTSDSILSTCEIDCCIANSYEDIDTNCGCSTNKIKNIQMSEFFLNAAKYAMNIGNDSKALGYIAKANELCKGNCKDC